MAFVITCPSCGLQGHVPDGVTVPPQVSCPRCSTPVTVTASVNTPKAEPRKQPIDEFFARSFDTAGASAPARPAGLAPSPNPAISVGATTLAPLSAPLNVGAAAPPNATSGPMTVVASQAAPSAPVAPPSPLSPAPAPPGQAPAASAGDVVDPKIEQDWLREERARLEAYMHKHFLLLKQQREEFSGWRTQVEAALVGREQELNRLQKHTTSQSATLTQREAAVAEKEANVQRQAAEAAQKVQQEIGANRETLDRLRKQIDHGQHALARAKTDLANFEKEALEWRQKHQAEQTDWQKKRAELIQRQTSLDNGLIAIRQKAAEVKAMETQVYHELEKQEQQIGIERRQLDQGRAELIASTAEKVELRRKVGALSQELERFRARLGVTKPAAPPNPPAPPRQ